MALVVASAATELWIVTDDPQLAGAFTLVVSGLLTSHLVAVGILRRAARLRDRKADRVRQAYIDDIETHLDLDRKLQARYPSTIERLMPRITRTPLPLGQNSRFINHVTIASSGDSTIELAEKGIDSNSEEVSFWRTTDVSKLALSGSSYRVLSPTGIVGGDPVSVMYFPYVPDLDRNEELLRRDFRANLPAIVAAVAEFNGRNKLPRDGSRSVGRYPCSAPRPTTEELQLCMPGVSPERARALLRSIDRIRDGWQIVETAYTRLPRSLCHNDITPRNVARVDNVTILSDFGNVAVGPIGSDLHTIIRSSGQAMHEPDHVEALFTTYVEALRAHHDSITVADVRLAAWTTFYLRYTNLNFSSARRQRPFRLALDQMDNLVQQLRESLIIAAGGTG